MRSLVTFAFVLAASLIFTIECAPKPWEDDSEYAYVSLDINAGVATPTTTTTQNHDAEAVPYASLEALFNNPESKQTGETSPCPTGGRITTANGTASASGTGLLKITGGSGIYRSVSASGSAPSQGTGGVPSYPISGAPYQNVTSPIFPSPSIPGLVPSPNLPYGSAGIPSPGASGEVQPSGLSNFCPSAATVTMPASTVTLPAETVTVTAQAEAQASADASAGAQIAPAVTVTTTIIITVTANQGASCPTGGNAGNLPPSPAVPSFTDQIPPASPVLPGTAASNQFPINSPSAGLRIPAASPSGGLGLPQTTPLNVASLPFQGTGGSENSNVPSNNSPINSFPFNTNSGIPSTASPHASPIQPGFPLTNGGLPVTAPYGNNSSPSGGFLSGSMPSGRGPTGGSGTSPSLSMTASSFASRPINTGASQRFPLSSNGFPGTGALSGTGRPPYSYNSAPSLSIPYSGGTGTPGNSSSFSNPSGGLSVSSIGVSPIVLQPSLAASSMIPPSSMPSNSTMPCASGQNQKQSYVATFDDLTTLSLSLPNVNIPSSVLDDTISVDKASPVPYQGLDWSDFKSTKNLLAFSQPNVFSYQPSSPDEKSSDTDVSHSGPAPSNKFVPTGGKGAFALEEMYVACIANSTEDTNAQSNTTLSRRALQVRDFVANNHWLRARGIEGKVGESTCDSCSIVITGITSSGKSVQTASLSFSPSKRGMQKMAFTDDWKDLKQVSIGAESCGKASEVGIDNVKYEVMSDCQ